MIYCYRRAHNVGWFVASSSLGITTRHIHVDKASIADLSAQASDYNDCVWLVPGTWCGE